MVEEIEALLPLFQEMKDGAIFALIAYMVWQTLMYIIWPFVVVFFLWKGFGVVSNFVSKNFTTETLVSKSFKVNGENYQVLASKHKIEELLSLCANPGYGYIRDEYIQEAMNKLTRRNT